MTSTRRFQCTVYLLSPLSCRHHDSSLGSLLPSCPREGVQCFSLTRLYHEPIRRGLIPALRPSSQTFHQSIPPAHYSVTILITGKENTPFAAGFVPCLQRQMCRRYDRHHRRISYSLFQQYAQNKPSFTLADTPASNSSNVPSERAPTYDTITSKRKTLKPLVPVPQESDDLD
ncbi:hypothetical protein IW261DRAFT_897955 [Armillaria novae-zelandiae]|uniref:Uncharacterized protein n=1 Tax=Armillaria novae-zelandiae TaxID=153914 RepID=A0AA39NT59_9AGAR|nr:hypothetical protein IW261DRAFT_897955 [Armillaria novae-zelandiae]